MPTRKYFLYVGNFSTENDAYTNRLHGKVPPLEQTTTTNTLSNVRLI